MQLAILHYSVPPIIGGVEVTIAAHTRLARAAGHTVKLIAGRGAADVLIPELDSRHPRVETVQRDLNRGIVTPEFHSLVTDIAVALKGVLADTAVLMAHNVVTLHKNLALTAALEQIHRAASWKLLAWCHDFAWSDPVYTEDVHPGAPWDLMRSVWDRVKYVVVSESRRDDLAQLLGIELSAIAVVPPGVDPLEFFNVSPTTARWVHELELLKAAPLLLLPARVTRRKNIELAIDLTAALHTQGLQPKLVVMGPLGPHNPANQAYRDELKARAAQTGADVVFLQEYGNVGDVERRDLYALASALLFPSAREGFGIPILEAGLARLPIFCADIPPFRESAQSLAHFFSLDQSPVRIAADMAKFFAHDERYCLSRRVVDEYAWETLYRTRIAPLLN